MKFPCHAKRHTRGGSPLETAPLIRAAGRNPAPAATKALLAAGADIEGRDKVLDNTPLIWAAHKSAEPEVVKALLAAGTTRNRGLAVARARNPAASGLRRAGVKYPPDQLAPMKPEAMKQPARTVAASGGGDRIAARIGASGEKIADFCKRWRIAEMALFGSVLRDDFSEDSDIDVLVVFEPDGAPGLDFVDMAEEMEALLGRSVDILGRSDVEDSPNYIRRREILNSARVIYAAK